MLAGLAETAGRWLAFRFEPEVAHRLAIRALSSGAPLVRNVHRDHRLSVSVNGLTVPNPLGVAAGFDKNAEVPDALLGAGFGFAEVGTITPLPQSGNPKPRVFRLPQDRAVINRLGFNNEGHAAALARLAGRHGRPGLVGVNIGANKDSADRIADYVAGLRMFYGFSGYFTVNISSPNTPGLRELQGGEQLRDLLGRIAETRVELAETHGRIVPILLKIAPDVTEQGLDDIVREVTGRKLDGLVVSNTTLSRHGLRHDPGEAGGLSGRPLFKRSTIVLAKARERIGANALLIGAGGVDTPETALAKIEAGADLVQLYTGMIYRGPGIANAIARGLSAALDQRGAANIGDLRDARMREWAAKPFPS